MLFEKSIVKKAKDGDSKALEKLYKDNFKSLYRFIRHKVNTNEHAEDVCAEAFTKAFENIGKFKETSSFKSWLYTIAKNLVYDWYKVKGAKVEIEDEHLERTAHNDNKTLGGSVEARRNESEVKFALSKLKVRHSEVLELRFILNYSLRETAEAMDTSVGNVKVLQHRAIKEARKLLLSKNQENKKSGKIIMSLLI